MSAVRVGLVARSENRGLGLQSLEFARHLAPSVLLVDVVGAGERGYPPHPGWYPGATRVPFNGARLDELVVRRWLDSVDVVYTAETLYDPRFPQWANAAGVATVVHINPEFYVRSRGPIRPVRRANPLGSRVGRECSWAPTTWRLDQLPRGTCVVPVPVALDRWPVPAAPHGDVCRWLHVAGKPTVGDRNGTQAVLAALPRLRESCVVTIVTQEGHFDIPPVPVGVWVRVVRGVADYWRLYDDSDALVLPRRYGGLSLPTQEAMGAGLAVLMTDCEPNPQTWPIATVKGLPGESHAMPGGRIEAANVDPDELAGAMDLFADPGYRHERQAAARAWAEEHSWARWTDDYRERLADVAGG